MNYLYYVMAKLNLKDIGAEGIVTDDKSLISNILVPVYVWAGAICVMIIIAAGLMYITSSGSADKVKKAKNAIVGAVIGLVVVILAFTITQFVVGRFQG